MHLAVRAMHVGPPGRVKISRNLLFLRSWNKVSVAQLRRAMNMGGGRGRAGGNAHVYVGLRTPLVATQLERDDRRLYRAAR